MARGLAQKQFELRRINLFALNSKDSANKQIHLLFQQRVFLLQTLVIGLEPINLFALNSDDFCAGEPSREAVSPASACSFRRSKPLSRAGTRTRPLSSG